MINWKKILALAFAATFMTNVVFAEEPEAPSELKADEIEYDMETQQAKATGSVNVEHRGEEGKDTSHLEADMVEYNLETQQARATGNVYIQHKETPDKEPSQLNADIVEYDLNSGIMTAAGNVLLRQGTARATGLRAMYNTQTQEAYLLDNVIAVRDDVRITCDRLLSNGAGHMQADGNVHGVQTISPNEKYPNGDMRTFLGDHVDYYPNEKKHIVIPAGGLVTNSDGDFTADFMEGWMDEEYYVGTGNAHAISPPREMEAGGDRMEYYGKDGGKAIITGNAWAIQENNTMRGNRLTVYLADDKNLKVQPAPQKLTAPKIEEFDVFSREKNNSATDNVTADKDSDVEKKSADENVEDEGVEVFAEEKDRRKD